MGNHLKRGDTVQVIAGTEKGKRGKVLRVIRSVPDADGRKRPAQDGGWVLVQGINLRYKHIRRSQKYPQGGRVQKEAPISLSNVMLYDPGEDRPVRTRMQIGDQGEKTRVSVRTGKPV